MFVPRRLLPRLLPVFTVLLLLLGSPAAGAAARASNAFLGYSRTGTDTFYLSSGALNGFEGSVFLHMKAFPARPVIGIDGDVARYGFGAAASVPRTTTFMVGPRVVVSAAGFNIFAHGLIGGEHSANSGGSVNISSTSYAYALGVGVDVPLLPAFAWRIQADRISAPTISPGTGIKARFSTGLVFKF